MEVTFWPMRPVNPERFKLRRRDHTLCVIRNINV
jgi:hypothetical protein